MPKGERPITRLPTLDADPERLFKLWQEAGRIPSNYNSWDELDADFVSRLNDGMTAKQAREAMGVTYTNVLGNNLLERNVSSKGEVRGLNKRAIREDFNIVTETHIRKTHGDDAVAQFRERLRNDWFNLSEGERVKVQRETGKQFHRGHGNAALEGGSVSINNMLPEHGQRNVAHGSAPRYPEGVMRDLGITENDMQDYYENILEREGLGRGTRPSNAAAIAADEQMVSFDRSDPRGYRRNNDAGIAPEQLEIQTQRLKELEQQGISRQAIDNFERNQSGTLSIGDSTAQSGPVRTVDPGRQRVKVVEPADPSIGVNRSRVRPRVVGRGAAPQPARQQLAFGNRLRGQGSGMKRVTRAIPGNYDDLAIGGLMSVGSGIATLLTTGNFAQAAEAALTNAVDYGTGDLDGGNLQDGTLSGVEAKAQQDPAFLGRQGPAVPPPTATQMPDRRTQAARRQQLTTAAPQPQAAPTASHMPSGSSGRLNAQQRRRRRR